MKTLKIYTFLTFLFLGSTIISAQSMLELYFGGNKDSLINEATKLIHIPEPTFKPAEQLTEPDPITIVQIIDKATHNGIRHNTQSFIFIQDWFSKL